MIMDSVASGSLHTYNISISNNIPVDIQVRGLGESADGAILSVEAYADISPYTARPWISIDNAHLEPGVNQNLTVSINIPSDTAPGERYASIYIFGLGGSGISFGVIVPIILTVDAAYYVPLPAGELTLRVPNTFTGLGIDIYSTFNNIGNCRIANARNKVVLKDTSQNIIWEKETPIGWPSLLPYYPRVIYSRYQPGLDPGAYTVISYVMLESGFTYSTSLNFLVLDHPLWDVNGDHVCDVLDLISVGNHIGESGAPGWIPQDTIQDGNINVLDLIMVGGHIGEIW